MSNLRATLESLLSALRHAGGDHDAARFEAEFIARDWAVELSDQLAVLAALQATAEQAMQPAPQPSPELPPAAPFPTPRRALAPLSPVPSRLRALAQYGPWVETLPSSWAFVEAVHDIFEVETRAQLHRALEQVFVEHLGYAAARLDDTPRVTNQKTLSHVQVVAKHREFCVIAVESRYAGPYLSSYELLFTLHPRALVFALERGQRVRVISRQTARVDKALGSRILHGKGKRSFPTDDPIVWARRLALLEPGPDDDARSLAQRAHELLASSARELHRGWTSRELSPDALPGACWEEAPALELESFLQANAEGQRLCFGLEAELRASFPWCSRDGFQLEYVGYRVESRHTDARRALQARASTRVVVTVDLEHRPAQGDPVPLTISLAVLTPSSNGRFVVFGQELEFSPRADTSPLWELDEDDEHDDALDDSEDHDNEDDERNEDNDDEWSTTHAYSHPNAYTNAGLIPLLRWAVGRRLRWYGRRFATSRPQTPYTVNSFKAWIGRWEDEHGATRGSSHAVLNYHLRPPVVPWLRTVPVERLTPPPAWACLDMSSELPAGSAYPVHGARIGPGGVLAAPLPAATGTLTLSARPATAHTSNPRVGKHSESERRPPFISTPLLRWSHLSVGSLQAPQHASTPPTPGCFIRVHGPVLRVCLTSERTWLTPQRCCWHVDVPAHFDLREDLELLVTVGEHIHAGTALVRVPSHAWGNDPEIHPHEVHRVAKIIERGAATAEPSRLNLIFAPPSLHGQLIRVEVAEIYDADRTLLARRVTFEVSDYLAIACAILPDGRRAPVELVGPQELPWQAENTELATGIIFDPLVPPPEEESEEQKQQSGAQWLDGPTGAPLLADELLDELTIIGERELGPDPALRTRVLDGWGHPRAHADPQLSLAHARWLAAAHPTIAARLHEAAAAPADTPPFSTTAAQLAIASHTTRPFFAPDGEGSAPTLGVYDPVRRAGHPTPWSGTRSPGGIWEWRCSCARLSGATQVGVSCEECSTPVARYPVLEAQHELSLPAPFIHPWRVHLVAALLGLTEAELRPIMMSEDCSGLAELTASALEQPHRSLHLRLAGGGPRDLLSALISQDEALDAALHHGLDIEDLWLTKLAVLSPRLLFDGYRLGSGELLQSPLTKHYRSIASLSELTKDRVELLPQLRRAQWIELQRRIEALFGDPEEPAPNTLAAYWRRVWPTSAPAWLPISAPGLIAHASPQALRTMWATSLWPNATLDCGQRPQLGLLTPSELIPVPALPRGLSDPASEQAWIERDAWSELIDSHFSWLVALMLGVDGDPRVGRAIRATLPPSISELQAVGRVLIRALIRGLAPPAGRPSKLLELVLARLPLSLPRSDDSAVQTLSERLAGLLNPGDPAAEATARVLVLVLSGFWRGPPSVEHPHGWIWARSQHDVPESFRRVVPRRADNAWAIWPDFDLLVRPIRALTRGAVVRPKGSSTRTWFTPDWDDLPGQLDWGETHPGPDSTPEPPAALATPESSPPIPESEKVLPASQPQPASPILPTEYQVVVIDASLRDWLAAPQI